MNSYEVTCCSTADMTYEYFQERKIPYVCFHFVMDGVRYKDDLGFSMPFDEFYRRIDEGAQPTTSQVNIGEFIDFFEPILQEGKDILHMTLSTGLSGSYNSAIAARNQLQEKYPERKIFIVDSLGASTGYGLLVDLVADLRDKGEDIDKLHRWVESNKLRIHHWFFTTDLSHLKRGGRISAASAFMGSLLEMCPLMDVNREGRLTPRRKIRGKKRVIEEMVKKMEIHAEGGTDYAGKCFMSHSACYDDAREVADLIEKRFPNLAGPVLINSVGTVIGSHTGPGTVALFFVGDERLD